jgi:hypothetical protein
MRSLLLLLRYETPHFLRNLGVSLHRGRHCTSLDAPFPFAGVPRSPTGRKGGKPRRLGQAARPVATWANWAAKRPLKG